MNLSEQTQRDFETIIETLDQRIHELMNGAEDERRLLTGLRDRAAGELRG